MKRGSYWFVVFYSIFLIICVFYPTIPLFGGISLRHVLSIIMFFLCFKNKGFNRSWFLILYLVFILFYFLSGVVTGHIGAHTTKIFGTYLSAVVMYSATKIMIAKYKSIKFISLLLLCVFVFDAIVTIGQFYQISQFVELPRILNIKVDEEFSEMIEQAETMEGFVLEGLVGAVMNGYVLSAATVLAWYPFKKKYAILINVACWIICILGSFYTQERSGFYLALFCSISLLLLKLRERRNLGLVLSLFTIALLFFFGTTIYEVIISTGRYQMTTEASREIQFSNGINFILAYPLGGDALYTQLGLSRPHNLLLNSFVVGGVFGGMCLIFIFIKQVILISKYIFKNKRKEVWLPLLYCVMYLNLTVNSFVHNASIAYGTILFFVFWGIVECFVDNKLQLEN